MQLFAEKIDQTQVEWDFFGLNQFDEQVFDTFDEFLPLVVEQKTAGKA